jgi:hypothetical protein
MNLKRKINAKLKKIKQKLGLKNKQTKNVDKNEEIEVLADIPPLNITSFEAITHFGLYGGGKVSTPKMPVLDEITRQKFKTTSTETQKKLLYVYICERSENGVWKKEGNRVIGEFFCVGRDLIQNRFSQLVNDGYLVELKDISRFYKINKKWGA